MEIMALKTRRFNVGLAWIVNRRAHRLINWYKMRIDWLVNKKTTKGSWEQFRIPPGTLPAERTHLRRLL